MRVTVPLFVTFTYPSSIYGSETNEEVDWAKRDFINKSLLELESIVVQRKISQMRCGGERPTTEIVEFHFSLPKDHIL
jgi:hypothetical protein